MFGKFKKHFTDIDDFMTMLRTKPVLSKYSMDLQEVDIMNQHWDNQFYGGSLFDAVRNYDGDGNVIYIPNSLESELNTHTREQSRKYHKYFVLENLIVNDLSQDNSLFVDIWLLCDTEGFSDADVEKMAKLSSNIEFVPSNYAPPEPEFQSFTQLSDLKIGGYGRMIFYEAHAKDPKTGKFSPLV